MTPHARSFALRAAAKVALATAGVGAASCGPEPQPVTAQTGPTDPTAAQPMATAGGTPSSPSPAEACVVNDVAAPTETELACCAQRVAKDGDSSAAYSRYERVQIHKEKAGASATPEARACCAAFYHASESSTANVSAAGRADWGDRRWECCTAFVDDKAAPAMAFARCTPWGPPVPPAMGWA